MPKSSTFLTRLSKIAAKFPEAIREDQASHASFVVRKKVFAYFLNNHHNDGIISIACKALPGDNKSFAAAEPTRYYLPAYIGPRGWAALRLDQGKVDWDEVSELMLGSYLLCAPKALARSVRPSTELDSKSAKQRITHALQPNSSN